ncbi:MAG: class I SAM-dependent methyltransferase [Bacteroidetes bacterium]|nr:class I SAM-dependent methyltransferase [Bacteroidota bacterium]
MNANKMLWEKGDFTKIAQTMRESGKTLVSQLGINKNQYILDLGCGDGTTAIPEAQLGATVLGVDIASNLVQAGNKRAAAENLSNCTFTEGDACALVNCEDNSFDMVISIFGAMFAPKPDDVAKEMVRVAKPGGKIIMGNWIPGDPTLVAQILKTCSAYTTPPPEGFISPMLWGVPEQVNQRFVQAGIAMENITCTKEDFTFHAPYSPAEYVSVFRHYYGPTMNAFDAAEKNGKAENLQQELETLFTSQNKSGDDNRTMITATYLKVVVTK